MKLLFFSFIVCCASVVSAQNQTIKFSDERVTKDRFLYPYMIQNNEDSIYLFAFDEYLRTSVWSMYEPSLKWHDKYRTIPSTSNSLMPFFQNGKWWAQRAFWSGGGVDSTFKVDLVELNDKLLPVNEPIVLFDDLKKGPMPMRIERRISSDGKFKAYFAIQDYVHPKAPGMHWLMDSETEDIYYSILGSDSLKVKNQGKIELPLKRVGERLSVKDFTVDNNGNIIVLADAITRKYDKAIGTTHLRPTVYFYNPTTKEVSFYEWPFEKQFITNLNVGFDAENNLICVAFYSELGYERRRGLVYVKLDARLKKVIKKELIPFSTKFLLEIHPRNKALAGHESIAHDIYFFRITPSGHVWIVAEEQVYDGGNSYWFNDLWAFCVSPEGKLVNEHYFKKRTQKNGVLRSSLLGFNGLIEGENLWIFYNNLKKKAMVINHMCIGQTPQSQLYPLPPKLRIMPSAAKQHQKNECVFLLTDEEFRRFKLMKIKLD